MKRSWTIIFCLIFTFCTANLWAQESGTEEDFYEEYEGPIIGFLRASTSLFTINATPAELSFQFADDDPVFGDTIGGAINSNSLWSYGLNLGIGGLLREVWVINIDSHLGFGSGGRLFNYVGQLGVGREFRFGKVYVQPSMALGFVYSTFRIGDYPPAVKNYFEVNNRFIFDNLTVRLNSHAFTISPGIMGEYAVNRTISVFAKLSVHYSFWQTNYVQVSGDTDEINADGEIVRAHERVNFRERGRLQFNINGQPILDGRSPYFHYNFNSLLIQAGISLNITSPY